MDIITVDYNMTLSEMIELCGYEGYAKEVTPERFPLRGHGKFILEPKLFRQKTGDQMATPNEMALMMKEEGFRPARIEELLAYSQTMTKRPARPIAAIGTVVEIKYPAGTHHTMPCIGMFSKSFEDRREVYGLYLDWFPLAGFPHHDLLGVRGVQPKS